MPASPFESPAAVLDHAKLVELLDKHGAIGVAEVMDFPGVINGDPEVLAKIAAAGGRRVDGHAPGIRGRQLDAYLAAGVESDHECTDIDEADEKRRKGMWIFVREGSASRNLAALVPTVLAHGAARIALCTDDREPDTLLDEGHINDCVRLAVAAGVPVEEALVLATSNPADYHRFDHLGWLAPGYQADVLCFDDLATFEPVRVWQAGRLVAVNGQIVPGVVPAAPAPDWMCHSVHLGHPPGAEAFELPVPASGRARVIGVESRSLSTKNLVVELNGQRQAVARIAAVERHQDTGRIGLGYVTGFGLVRGAIASTVAHDAHNCMVVGARDSSGPAEMAAAVARLAEIGGGQVAVLDGRVIGEVALRIGGLMSDKGAAEVAGEVRELSEVVSTRLGLTIEAPFMQLSFLGLTVIPELRMTDRGLFDVNAFSLVDVAV